METNEKVIEKKEIVHEEGKKEYASKGMAGTALGFGIGGAVLGAAALWGRGRGVGGGGSVETPGNVNIITTGGSGGNSAAPTAFEAWTHECDDMLKLTNEMWGLKVNTMTQMYNHRQTDVAEKFSLWKGVADGDFANYKAIRDLFDSTQERLNNAAFGLYKNQRDGFDALANRICCLEKEVAVNAAIRPYQDRLIQAEIEKAFTAGVNYTDRKTCHMITGQVVLPSTPSVTGYGSYCCCSGNQSAA